MNIKHLNSLLFLFLLGGCSNRGCHVSFVMEYGIYSYKDEITGAGSPSIQVIC